MGEASMHYQMTVFTPHSLGNMLLAGTEDPMLLMAIEVVQVGLHKIDTSATPKGCSLCGNELKSSGDVSAVVAMVPVVGGAGHGSLGFALCDDCTGLPIEALQERLIALVGQVSRGPVRKVHVHTAGHA
jgi:hypothetical protein